MRAAPRGPRPAAVALGLLIAAAAGLAQAPDREAIRLAVGSGAYGRAVFLALGALESDPADTEVRFLLARAYAYAGHWDEAEAVLGGILAGRPEDSDALLLRARILSWRGDFDGAELIFRRVLALEPGSADARAGLADLAAWRGRPDEALALCRQALEIDPLHAGALFRTGSVLLGRGDYGRARDFLARAVELEPGNRDFARALGGAVPPLAPRTEVWVSGRRESWSDGRDDYADLGLSALFGVFDDRARLLVKVDRAWRAGGHDDRIGLEAYPRLWKGAYGYFDLSLAPRADFVASSSFHAEVTQSLLTRFEVSLGARRMRFAAGDVSLVTASASAYWGRFIPNIRVFWADAGTGTETTWMAGLRGYFSGESYAWASFGRGTRSFETGSVEEVLAGPAWFAEAGFDVYVSRTVKVRAYLSRRRETAGPSSTAFALVTGYRF
mgnify:CR=1 FL=1